MRTLYSFSNFLLGVYYGGLFYWFFNGNMEQWLGFLVLLAAGIALTLPFPLSSAQYWKNSPGRQLQVVFYLAGLPVYYI